MGLKPKSKFAKQKSRHSRAHHDRCVSVENIGHSRSLLNMSGLDVMHFVRESRMHSPQDGQVLQDAGPHEK